MKNGRIVSLVHEDAPSLCRMTVFDVLVKTADREGNHVPATADDVDHGLIFPS